MYGKPARTDVQREQATSERVEIERGILLQLVKNAERTTRECCQLVETTSNPRQQESSLYHLTASSKDHNKATQLSSDLSPTTFHCSWKDILFTYRVSLLKQLDLTVQMSWQVASVRANHTPGTF